TGHRIIDQDDHYVILDLGNIAAAGVTLGVELHAFSESEQGEANDDYDLAAADVFVGPRNPGEVDMLEMFDGDDLIEPLKAHLTASLPGPSNVGLGESGAQSPEQRAYGRNGW
ncbi:MAG: hypothetical protein KI788_06265, partial [Mameliella sp.]|nr:hypothetical protein [Mameliella sp.]